MKETQRCTYHSVQSCNQACLSESVTKSPSQLLMDANYSCLLDAMLRCSKPRVLVLGVALMMVVTLFIHAASRRQPIGDYRLTGDRHSEQLDHMVDLRGAEHRNTIEHGYILTLGYTGQQIAGGRGILTQQCWVAAFNLPLKIVEPFMIHSTLVHSKTLWTNPDSHRFSDYYDMPHFNQLSQNDGHPALVQWATFMETAPRKVILLNIAKIHSKDCLSYRWGSLCHDTKHITSSKDFISGCETSSEVDLEGALGYLKGYGFEVVRRVCLNCAGGRPQINPTDIVKYIFGKWRAEEVVLVINQWKFSIQMTPDCRKPTNMCEKLQFNRFYPGPKLLEDAQQYIQTSTPKEGTGKASIVVAIMVRIEWFLITYQRKSLLDKVRDCLSKVTDTLKELSKPDTQVSPVLALDIGTFGSGTFNGTLRRQGISSDHFDRIVSEVKRFVLEVHGGALGFEGWEKTYSTVVVGEEDRGYIAALQSTVASEADCLVQMGGGHYQQLALTQYLHNHPSRSEQCVHQICTPDKGFKRVDKGNHA